ncbi:MAG: TonB-dependent receptor [Achromobacter sp.]|uniref:TonB-dependent receptor n=1 Tax=Achromobacter sp. TaxID=134375 RepID=UPI002586C07F|nr:TonB-dependent receptor [Achromobacter sp.]MCW0206098.1 TonB-dependent receptor [Achromobacter sp.]
MRRLQHHAHPGLSPSLLPRPVAVNRIVRKALLGAILMTGAAAGTAYAQAAERAAAAAVHAYDVPAGPLAGALSRFADQANILLSVPADMTAGKTSPGVRGAYTVDAAFRILLGSTGLQAVRRADGGYSLRPAPAAAETTLPAVLVTGSAAAAAEPYPGGEVARGARIGLLGDRDFLDTPFSVTSYTSKLIEDQQAQNIGDVLVNDPSVRNTYSRGAGRDEFNIRGFTLFNYDVAYNGLYGISPRNSTSLIGIERVEVLRGPNALLNGMAPFGSVGGSINLVPKRAGADPLNRVTLSYIENNQFGVQADIARRFGEDQRAGVRLNALRSGGDMNISGAGEDMGAFSLGLDYRGNRFRIEGDINYQNRVTDARSGLLFPPSPGEDIGHAPDPKRNFFPDWTYWKAKEWTGDVRAEYDLSDDWTVYGALGARKHDFESLQTTWLMLDSDGMIGSIPARLNEKLWSKTGEVGIRGRFDTGPIKHEPVLSASFLDIDYSSARVRSSSTVFSDLYHPADLAKPSIPKPSDLGKTSETRLYSIALADTLSALDGAVQLTGGLRQQRVQSVNYNPATGDRVSDYGKSAVTPAIALTVRPTRELALYGNYIEGLSQGGTAPAEAVNAGETFKPDVSKQYEVGVKYDFGTVATTLSAFQIEQPSAYLDPDTMRYQAAGRQRNRGLEFLVQGEPVRRVRLLGGVAYTAGVLTKTEGGVNDGHVAPAVPRWQFNAAAEWDTPFVEGLTLMARVLRTSTQYVDAANTQQLPSWTRYDVGARYAMNINGTPVTLRATVENVFNKHYWLSAAREGLTVAAPRTVLLSVTAEF